MSDESERRNPLVTLALWAGFVVCAGFALQGLPLFQPKRAPTSLVPSSWKGVMTFLGTSYPFELTIEVVDDDGSFRGRILWPQYFAGSSIRGTADGDHLVFVDADRDEKDVIITGADMRGTDKNGRATFTARRTDAGPALVQLPPLDPAWARQAAVCEGLAASTWSPDIGVRCWRALAVAARDLAACKRVPSEEDACARDVAAARGDVAGCRGDVECLLAASLHGAGEAACEKLGDRRDLARCLAGVRASAAPCEGLDGPATTRCLDHLARATQDADGCERLATPGAGDLGVHLREQCLLAVGRATRRFDVCERLESDPRRSTLGALARKDCLRAVQGPLGRADCRKLGSSGERSACLLRFIGNAQAAMGEVVCGEVADEPMRAACVKAAKLPAAPLLDF